MKIHLGRRLGKTTKAVDIANETGAYLIVRNRTRAQELGKLTDRFPITFDELIRNKMRGSYVRKVVIDDFDTLLAGILADLLPGIEVEAITFTESPDKIVEKLLSYYKKKNND
jgi:hypothetical protein